MDKLTLLRISDSCTMIVTGSILEIKVENSDSCSFLVLFNNSAIHEAKKKKFGLKRSHRNDK